MITLIAFLLTMIGCINWLLIGLLQYDFIAGFFGFQASIFSRLIYILFGIGAVYLVIRTIANKGSVKIYEKKNKKQKQEYSQAQPVQSNVEAERESVYLDGESSSHDKQSQKGNDKDFEDDFPLKEKSKEEKENKGLLDEHFYQ